MKLKFRTRVVLLILLVALLIGLISFVDAKYADTISYRGKITFSAKLANNVELRESQIVRQADGIYETTGTTVTNTTQNYKLVPGQDIPKNPHIIIEGKTKIPAYLYVEIVDTLDTVEIGEEEVKLIDYSLTPDWERAADQSLNKHGGTVYQYRGGILTDTNTLTDPIYILQDNQVTVSQYVKSHDITQEQVNDNLTFYVYLIETINTN